MKKIGPTWKKIDGLFQAIDSGTDSLPAGVYRAEDLSSGIWWNKVEQFGDKVFDLPGLPNEFIMDQVNKFWSKKDVYDHYNFVHKRGILLYGPPGNGKTSVISSLVKDIVSNDGVVLLVNYFSIASSALKMLRKVEPNRRVMTLMEDMDTLLSGDYKSQEPYALSLLDGQDQIQSVLHVATTNYPELLADRFIKRPGRFDLVIGMGNPLKETRKAYFQNILGDPNHPALDYLTDRTEGLSLAYLKEIASSYLCLDIPVEESVGRLKKAFTSKVTTKPAHVGFKLGYEHDPDSAVVAEDKQTTDVAQPATPSKYFLTGTGYKVKIKK